MNRASTSIPQLAIQACLNSRLSDHAASLCHRCADACPADAICTEHESGSLPVVDADICSGCMACVSVCPTHALRYTTVRPAGLIREVIHLGKRSLHAACSMVECDADLRIDCHAVWSPLLFAACAAEGVRKIYLNGTDRCEGCPKRYGATVIRRAEADYATLNQALGVKLELVHGAPAETAPLPTTQKTSEPARRAFFRQLIPSIAENVAKASEELADAARQAAAQPRREENRTSSTLPVQLQLFLRALPRLHCNFTPLPVTPSLPLGAIQADASCTACGDCVELCPTEALAIRPFGANNILEFHANRCIGCNHCVELCPEQALKPLPGISLPAVVSGKTRPLIMVSQDSVRMEQRSDRNTGEE